MSIAEAKYWILSRVLWTDRSARKVLTTVVSRVAANFGTRSETNPVDAMFGQGYRRKKVADESHLVFRSTLFLYSKTHVDELDVINQLKDAMPPGMYMHVARSSWQSCALTVIVVADRFKPIR